MYGIHAEAQPLKKTLPQYTRLGFFGNIKKIKVIQAVSLNAYLKLNSLNSHNACAYKTQFCSALNKIHESHFNE